MEIQDATLRAAAWVGNGIQTNPGINTILADTGALPQASADGHEYDFLIVVSSTAAADVSIEHRNAANGANVEAATHVMPNSLIALFVQAKMAKNQRLRLIMAATLAAGRISATIHRVRAHD